MHPDQSNGAEQALQPESADDRRLTPPESWAMQRALQLAATPGIPLGPNPRVGCVLLGPEGQVVGEGYHQGAGTPHAEVSALRSVSGHGPRPSTAVVTLEPCNHHGRTGPCAQALIDAGIARVVYAQTDPNPVAAGGRDRLLAAGVTVVAGPMSEAAEALNPEWTFAVTHGRPFVTWKVAASLDGRVAARDGSSRWITSSASRADVHALRAQVQAVMIGTGTALADNPSLTVRDSQGRPRGLQPLRVVFGRREIPVDAKLRDGAASLVQYTGQDLAADLCDLGRREVRHAMLEGGPTLAAGFIRAGLVDRIRWYVAPALLGAGRTAVGDLGVADILGTLRGSFLGIRQLGPDVVLEAVLDRPDAVGEPAEGSHQLGR